MAEKPSRGLADVIAASTALSDMDGQAGRLFYQGYDIDQLAGPTTIEEIACVLQREHAPSRGELDGYRAEIAAGRSLGGLVGDGLAEVACRPGLAGWTARITEQHADNRLIRADSGYTGESGLSWAPLEVP